MHRIIQNVIRRGNYLGHLERTRPEAVQPDTAVRPSLAAVREAAVYFFHKEGRAPDGFAGLLVDLADDEAGAGAVGKGHGNVFALFSVHLFNS